MARCELCGNDYDKSFELILGGTKHVFDSFECAIEAVAPRCGHCGCRIIGHGTEVDGQFFCCAHCASTSGEADSSEVIDRVDESTRAADRLPRAPR